MNPSAAAVKLARRSTWVAWSCPYCESALSTWLTDNLHCEGGHYFPVRKGIPRFVSDNNYAAHFGKQWNQYRKTQLDSYTGIPISRERLIRCIGLDVWDSLSGKQVLEVGCGAGRFTEVLLTTGAYVTSIDLSAAVDANAEQFPASAHHRLAQADLHELPFATGQFDLVLCLGVVQHTPSSDVTIRKLFNAVRPGGWLVIDHYTDGWKWYFKTAPLFEVVLSRVSPNTSIKVTRKIVDCLLPWHKRVARSRWRSVLHRLSPVMSHYNSFPELSDDLQYEWALLDTHDTLTNRYKHFRSLNSISENLAEAGGLNIHCARAGNGVEARAQRP